MDNILYYGPPLTGKTTELFGQYKKLAAQFGTDRILVMVSDAQQVGRWREDLADLPVAGGLRIFTYWGFIQAEITRYWHWIDSAASAVRPTFINAEGAHYLMTTLINQARPQGMLDAVVATPHRIALQILQVLNHAAMSGYSYEEAYGRLRSFMGTQSDKQASLLDAMTIAGKYRETLTAAQCIDYGMAVEIYNKHLLTNIKYIEILPRTYSCVLADNLEESFPVQIDLLKVLLDGATHAYAAYDPTGGHTRYFGADPEYALAQLKPRFVLHTCNTLYGCSEEAPLLADAVTQNILQGTPVSQIKIQKPTLEVIATDYRSESISVLVAGLEKLIAAGCPPGEIGIITPGIDRVLDITLAAQAEARGIPLESLTRKEFLSDEPFAQVMVSLAALINQDLTGNRSDLARTLGLLLNLDPVRSHLLAVHCQKHGLSPLPPELVTRIGFAANERYQEFCLWVDGIRATVSDENMVFQHLFSEMVAPLVEDYEDIITSRQIIKSAIGFERVQRKVAAMADMPFLNGFVEMIRQGTVAAEVIRMRDIKPDAVVLATPVALFKSGRSFTYQFWLDCSSEIWFRSDVNELTNPHLLTRSWDGDWNYDIDSAKRAENAARTAAGLIYRCREHITMLTSDYSSLGLEQEGSFHERVAESVVTS